MNYNKKCKGCGNYLSSDINSIGYVKKYDEDTKYCVRCFKLKNYGEIIEVDNSDIIKNLNSINFGNNLILLVLDLFDLINSTIKYDNFTNNILVVVNKISALPKNINKENFINIILNILNEKKIEPIDIILYDSIDNINLKKIMNHIENATKNKQKTYFIGKTNVGKSTLINKLLKLNKKEEMLICSPFKNTTLNLIKIEIKNNKLIDTPGYPNDNSITSNIAPIILSNISKYKFHSSSSFIYNDNQAYFIEQLFGLFIKKINKKLKSSIVFYKSSYLNIFRMKAEKINSFLIKKDHINYNKDFKFVENKFKLEPNNKYLIFISGISLAVIQGVEEIVIIVPKEINFSIIKNSII